MSPNKNTDLIDALDNYTVEIMKISNPYTTKESIQRKIFQECADILNICLSDFIDKRNVLHIHPDVMDQIDFKWQRLIEQGVKISHDDQNTYKLLKSSDFVNYLDVQKFIHILSSKNEDDFLAELLAIDGFQGETKNYIENLKFGDKGSGHIQAVRELYRKYKPSVKTVYYILLRVFQTYPTDPEIQHLVAEELDKGTGVADTESMVQMYENSVDDLKSIALTKLAQLKNQQKKIKKHKKKAKTSMKESKKSKMQEEDEP